MSSIAHKHIRMCEFVAGIKCETICRYIPQRECFLCMYMCACARVYVWMCECVRAHGSVVSVCTLLLWYSVYVCKIRHTHILDTMLTNGWRTVVYTNAQRARTQITFGCVHIYTNLRKSMRFLLQQPNRPIYSWTLTTLSLSMLPSRHVFLFFSFFSSLLFLSSSSPLSLCYFNSHLLLLLFVASPLHL